MKEPSIRLHEKHGVNPHVTKCEECGKDTSTLVLLGDQDRYFTCAGCGLRHLCNAKPPKKCAECGTSMHVAAVQMIEEGERIPHGLCDDCQARQDKTLAEVQEILANGGILFRCRDCGKEGALKKCALADAVRKQMKKPAPEPCGVEITKAECPYCGSDTP